MRLGQQPSREPRFRAGLWRKSPNAPTVNHAANVYRDQALPLGENPKGCHGCDNTCASVLVLFKIVQALAKNRDVGPSIVVEAVHKA